MYEKLESPRIHVFLWLFAKNKLPTRDNLSKRKTIDDKTCIFYSECESLVHLFLTDVSLFSYGLLLLKCWGFRLARTLSQWLSYGLTIRNLN
jgi:hypothetical protein